MALLGEPSYALLQSSARAIGTILADVTVEENHRDEVIITQHPVEGGGVIADHAYKRPAELEIRCGFSNASAGYVGYVQEQYEALLKLQLDRQLFDVYTGKRRYRNMLIRGLSVATDPRSENILMASVALQEVVLVSTQTTGTGTNTAATGGSSDQDNPASTGSVTNGGTVAATNVGPQAFIGAFNPGVGAQPGDLGLGGAVGEGLAGLSPPAGAVDVGELVGTDPATGAPVPGATAPASPGFPAYNPFIDNSSLN